MTPEKFEKPCSKKSNEKQEDSISPEQDTMWRELSDELVMDMEQFLRTINDETKDKRVQTIELISQFRALRGKVLREARVPNDWYKKYADTYGEETK